MRRVEDKIRRLCTDLTVAKDDTEVRAILAELQEALHQYIERLRSRLPNYPITVERRARNEIPENSR
jgi:hypothetical protein